MQRRWKFLAITVTGVVAGSMALTSLAAGSTAATKVRVPMAFTGHLAVSPNVVKAGMVTFVITNTTNIPKKVNGIVQGSELKRFVLLKTNLAPGKLPTTKDGHALEKGRVGKAVMILPGKTETITLDLKPGKYVVVSNNSNDYNYGEYSAFTVIG
jgi:hypothetical protein